MTHHAERSSNDAAAEADELARIESELGETARASRGWDSGRGHSFEPVDGVTLSAVTRHARRATSDFSGPVTLAASDGEAQTAVPVSMGQTELNASFDDDSLSMVTEEGGAAAGLRRARRGSNLDQLSQINADAEESALAHATRSSVVGEVFTSGAPSFVAVASHDGPRQQSAARGFNDMRASMDLGAYFERKGIGEVVSGEEHQWEQPKVVSGNGVVRLSSMRRINPLSPLHGMTVDEDLAAEMADAVEVEPVDPLLARLARLDRYSGVFDEESLGAVRTMGNRSNSYEGSLDELLEELPEVEYEAIFDALSNGDGDGDVGADQLNEGKIPVHDLLLKVFMQLNGGSDDTVLTDDELHAHLTFAALEHELPELLPMLDSDGDGEITPAEIMAHLDTDGNGEITIVEFTQNMQRLLAKHDAVEVALGDLYNEVDGDADV